MMSETSNNRKEATTQTGHSPELSTSTSGTPKPDREAFFDKKAPKDVPITRTGWKLSPNQRVDSRAITDTSRGRTLRLRLMYEGYHNKYCELAALSIEKGKFRGTEMNNR